MRLPLAQADAAADTGTGGSLQALVYACLVVLVSGLSVGIISVGSKYAFKDELHLTASQLSYWNTVIDLPLLFSFSFGWLRNRWQPFGVADRPYLLASPLLIGGCGLLVGARPRSLPTLMALLLLVNASAMLGAAAMNGMLAKLSKRFGISGRVSVMSNVIPRFLGFVLLPLAGRIVESAGFSAVCYVSAGMASSVIVLAFYRPRELFPDEDRIFGRSWAMRGRRTCFIGPRPRGLRAHRCSSAPPVGFSRPIWRTSSAPGYTSAAGFCRRSASPWRRMSSFCGCSARSLRAYSRNSKACL